MKYYFIKVNYIPTEKNDREDAIKTGKQMIKDIEKEDEICH